MGGASWVARGPAANPLFGRRLGGRRRLLTGQFVGESPGVIDFAQRFDDALRVDGDGAGLFFAVDEVQDQRLDVAVEDQAYQLGVLVDDRAARIAADDVGRADEVERRFQVEFVL